VIHAVRSERRKDVVIDEEIDEVDIDNSHRGAKRRGAERCGCQRKAACCRNVNHDRIESRHRTEGHMIVLAVDDSPEVGALKASVVWVRPTSVPP
jgi:hypothetical protein